MEQEKGHLSPATLSDMASLSCSDQNRLPTKPEDGKQFVSRLRSRLGLSDPVAANYLTVKHEPFVDSILEYCSDRKGPAAFA